MTGQFYRVKCQKCSNEQVIFGKTATLVKCAECGEVLAQPTGGRADVKATVLEALQ